ncbi:unnamed protein product [Albugo candida]|uniref:Uncharacterized protein n=1 Tax=Albugo candida TaxID=65357 RepID=A0A024GBF3_9STRA|nr:unnamed protein product [Albugo candida]|eukprot:CCI43667.1 unnamed protein product [Albugo candida]
MRGSREFRHLPSTSIQHTSKSFLFVNKVKRDINSTHFDAVPTEICCPNSVHSISLHSFSIYFFSSSEISASVPSSKILFRTNSQVCFESFLGLIEGSTWLSFPSPMWKYCDPYHYQFFPPYCSDGMTVKRKVGLSVESLILALLPT